MYRYISSHLKPIATNEPYQNVNIAQMTMRHLLDNYLDGYITLSHTALKANVYIELDTLRTMRIGIPLKSTFNEWLQILANVRLPTKSKAPEYNIRRVYARDAVLADFKIHQCEPYKPYTSNASIANKTNLYVEGLPKATRALKTRCLTTVNGLLHRNFPYANGVQIHGGGITNMMVGVAHVGVWSFEAIGDIAQIAITSEMIGNVKPSIPLSSSFMLNLGHDLTDKSIVLSLGGFAFINPSFVRVVNDREGLLLVDSSKIDISQCLLSSRKLINISDLGIFDPTDTDNESYSKLQMSYVSSDVLVRKWLTLDQSFVAVVDTPNLTVKKHSTHWTGLYGVYEYHTNPYHILQDSYGRCPEYWVKKQNEAWIILVDDPVYYPYITQTTNQDEINFRNEAIPYHVETEIPMTMLEVISEIKTT